MPSSPLGGSAAPSLDSAPSRAAEWFALVLLGAVLAGLLAGLAVSFHPRFLHLADSVDSQRAILERRPFIFEGRAEDFPSWRGRILIPHAIDLTARVTGLRFSQAYLVVRFLSALAALAAFGWLARRHFRGGPWTAGLAAVLLAVALIPTFHHIYDIPSDFSDAALFALLTLAALEKRRAWFALCLLVALLNRESALLALLVWFVLHVAPWGRSRVITEALFCSLLGLAGAAFLWWLRGQYAVVWAGPAPPAGLVALTQPVTDVAVPLGQIGAFLAHPSWHNPLFFLVGYLLIFGTLIAAGWRTLQPDHQRLALAALSLFIISVPFANLPELRVYIPSILLGTLVLQGQLLAQLGRSNA